MKNESKASGFEPIWPHCLPTGREEASGSVFSLPSLSAPEKHEDIILLSPLLGALRDSAQIQLVSSSPTGSLFWGSTNGGKCQSWDMMNGKNQSLDVQVTFSFIFFFSSLMLPRKCSSSILKILCIHKRPWHMLAAGCCEGKFKFWQTAAFIWSLNKDTLLKF